MPPEMQNTQGLEAAVLAVAAAIQKDSGTVVLGTNTGAGAGSANYIKIGSLMIAWGTTASVSVAGGGASNRAVVFPFKFGASPTVIASSDTGTGAYSDWIINTAQSVTTTGFTLQHHNTGAGASSGTFGMWVAVGIIQHSPTPLLY